MTSYQGQLLFIDLTHQQGRNVALESDLMHRFIGGKGFGAKLLYDLMPPGCPPYAAENPLMFLPGPLTGTLAPSMRGCVVTKSPLTGTFADSYFGGHFSPEIKYTGYDGIVILGKADRPLFLWIDDDRIEFRDASHLWGLNTFETNHRIKADLNDDSVKIACIGPAGENRVRFALISCEYNRQAGRGGTGAVMGAKNLKAIALRGSHLVEVHDSERFLSLVQTAYQECNEQTTGNFTTASTPAGVDFSDAAGLFPTRNYIDGTFEHAAALNSQAQKKALWLRSLACAGCAIRCGRMGKIRSGKYAGTISDVVEYESLGMLGSNLGIGNVKSLTHLHVLCDQLGMDSISAGGVIGFAMEAFQKGLIRTADTDDHQLEFGNTDAAAYLLHQMATRRGKLGQLLSQGVKKAADALGEEGQAFAVHVKGMDIPAWGPRGAPAMGLAYATADRGGCHMRAFPITYEFGGEWEGKPVEQLSLDAKAAIVAHEQDRLSALNTLVMCDFAAYGIRNETYRGLLSAATGITLETDQMTELGERIWNQVRLFNLREGFKRRHDTLPRRFMKEPLPGGPARGHRIAAKDMEKMLDDYYHIRGWDAEGKPTPATLCRLKLN